MIFNKSLKIFVASFIIINMINGQNVDSLLLSKKYTVSIYQGKIAPLQLINKDGRHFRTVIKYGYKNGVNFSGHYCLIYWGCGSPCKQAVIVDVKTGRVCDWISACYEYICKSNSRVLITDTIYESSSSFCIPKYYIFNEKKRKLELIKTKSH